MLAVGVEEESTYAAIDEVRQSMAAEARKPVELILQDRIGTLEPGKDADFVIWDIAEPAELAYRIGANPVKQVVRQGRLIRTTTPETF